MAKDVPKFQLVQLLRRKKKVPEPPFDQPATIAGCLSGVPKDDYGECYTAHLLEQYKTYLEMADKVSERRVQHSPPA
jgi:hypothetical protein